MEWFNKNLPQTWRLLGTQMDWLVLLSAIWFIGSSHTLNNTWDEFDPLKSNRTHTILEILGWLSHAFALQENRIPCSVRSKPCVNNDRFDMVKNDQEDPLKASPSSLGFRARRCQRRRPSRTNWKRSRTVRAEFFGFPPGSLRYVAMSQNPGTLGSYVHFSLPGSCSRFFPKAISKKGCV